MRAKDLAPLDWQTPIVDGSGRPSPEFQRRWNTQRSNNGLIGSLPVGNGPPAGTPSNGQEYVDVSATPPTLYVGALVGADYAWQKVGVFAFVQLSDVPSSYTGAAGKLLQVNSGADRLEFSALSAVLDALGSAEGDLLYRSSTGWTVLAPGTAGNLLRTGGVGADPAWAGISAVLDSISSSRGTILYRGAAGWSALAPGTSGNVLQTAGAGADPAWATPSSGDPNYNHNAGRPTTGTTGEVITDTGGSGIFYVGSASTPASHKGWRMVVFTNGSANIGAAEFGLCTAAGGSTITAGAGGTPFFSTPTIAGSAADLFDNNAATICVSNGNVSGMYFGYIFPTAKNIAEIYIQARPSFQADAPLTAKIQYSDNTTNGTDGTWTDALTGITFTTWSAGQIQRKTVPATGSTPAVYGVVTNVPLTFATLPASPGDGERHFITDSPTAASGNYAANVTTGGGANHVWLYWDAGQGKWCIG